MKNENEKENENSLLSSRSSYNIILNDMNLESNLNLNFK